MKDHSNTDGSRHHEEDAEGELIGLGDFPTTWNNHRNGSGPRSSTHHQDRIRSSSEPSDFFEFFHYDLSCEMSHAEDLIFCGKLNPFHNHQQPQQPTIQPQRRNIIHRNPSGDDDQQRNSLHHRRSESFSELRSSSQSNHHRTQLTRTSRSLNYEFPRRTISGNSETSRTSRSSSVKSIARADTPGQKVLKPRWYVLMFGSFKFPREMELRDIKNRQVRRTPSTMFQAYDGRGGNPVRGSHRKSSWSLLKLLSCKGTATVAVTTSMGCMPKVQGMDGHNGKWNQL